MAAAEPEIHFHKRQLEPRFFCEGANVGDFNRDGKTDVIAGPFWYAGPELVQRHAIYPPVPFQPKGYSHNFLTFVHDINGDGWDDVVQCDFPGREVRWYENPQGERGHWPQHPVIDAANSESPTLTDLTGDGQPELVTAHSGYFGYASPNDEDPSAPWVYHRISDDSVNEEYAHGLGVGDVDGDGRLDLLDRNGWWQQPPSLAGDPQWTRHLFPFAETGGAQMYAYDVDGDGDQDVITSLNAHAYGLAWWEQVQRDGQISFSKHLIIGDKPEQSPYSVAFSQMHSLDLVDINGDGLRDIVTGKRFWAHNGSDPGGGDPVVLYWFELRRKAGQAEFVPHKIDDDSGVGTQVVVRDVNADGRPDIVVGNKKGTIIHLQSTEESGRATSELLPADVTEITDVRDKSISPPASALSDGDNETQWFTAPGVIPPEAQPIFHLDLGTDRYVGEISFWNYRDTSQNKVAEMTIRFATEAEGVGGFGTSVPDKRFRGLQFEGHLTEQKLSLGGSHFFRYAELRLIAGAGGNRIGFTDIKFRAVPLIVSVARPSGVIVVKEQGETSENFSISLAIRPTDAVTITLDPITADVGLGSRPAGEPHELLFDETNWSERQSIAVRAVDDTDAEGPENSRIRLRSASRDARFNAQPISPITVVVIDNDVTEIMVPDAPNDSEVVKVTDRFIAAARRSGDAHRGLQVFGSAKSACLSCHKVGRHGGALGPDLSELAKQQKPAEIVAAVLWPRRQVKPEYVAHAVLTEEGRSERGYIIRRDDRQLVLRDPTRPEAGDILLDVDEIAAEQEVGTLMPDNLIAALTDGQAYDLFRFLLGLGLDTGVPAEQLDSLLLHAHAHQPATFPHDRKPLRPEYWPSWEHPVNRERVYDFYAKQADYFREQPDTPHLLTGYPGLDGGQQGHWGNQNDKTWAGNRWNEADVGSLQCGVFHGEGLTVPRGVCVRLGDHGEMSVCFNPDELTYDAVWTGGFIKFSSFRDGFLDGLRMDGSRESRPDGQKPQEPFRYRGFYRHGRRVIFAYRVGDTEYLDAPWVSEGKFTRDVAPADEHPLRHLCNGGGSLPATSSELPAASPQPFETPINIGSRSPYAIDTIDLPTDNPWKIPITIGGLDFLPDGSAMVCTMHGEVWHLTDFAWPSTKARWSRFASGLHQLLGLVIDDDGIFVLGRDQITRLHDQNQDGKADFYECFSNAYATSTGGHDFLCGLERDGDGNFYTASSNQGLVRISPDGNAADVVATGFRNPDGLGVLPDGTITVPCSEGGWTPASMICAVRPSDEVSFHGHHRGERAAHARVPELPLVYLPRGLDSSAGGQTVVTSERWGPLTGQLLHFSYGSGAHFLVLRDDVDGQLQGAVVPLPGEFRSGAHRGRFSPTDGQLYVGGMHGWGTYTVDEDGCLQRVRYTGDEVQLPVGFHVHENGILLRFSSSLTPDVAAAADQHFAQCWNYRYTGSYGSHEFSTLHFGMRGHDVLEIASAHVLDEGRTLFLEIPEVQPVYQLHLRVRSNPGTDHELFVTAHQLDAPFTGFDSYRPTHKTVHPHPIQADLAMATRSIPNPHRKEIDNARSVSIKTGTNLSYQTRSFRVRAGEPIALTLANPDVVPHNWALARPGTLQRVGQLANQLIADPEAAVRHYIPSSPDVIAYTDVVLPGEQFTIYFYAPDMPGRYPFLCTFPGHWMIMNGEMIVQP